MTVTIGWRAGGRPTAGNKIKFPNKLFLLLKKQPPHTVDHRVRAHTNLPHSSSKIDDELQYRVA